MATNKEKTKTSKKSKAGIDETAVAKYLAALTASNETARRARRDPNAAEAIRRARAEARKARDEQRKAREKHAAKLEKLESRCRDLFKKVQGAEKTLKDVRSERKTAIQERDALRAAIKSGTVGAASSTPATESASESQAA